ncbi:hypothetical protein IIA15_11435, partial [candidate division TA06 bacterium]|nr:hypothetical protein [candidate division TA06 bacterium]
MSMQLLLQGHILKALKTLKNETIHCVVTSPPYLGLRDYSIPLQVWGGDEGCEHRWGNAHKRSMNFVQSPGNPDIARPHREKKSFETTTKFCSICNAWLGSLGSEPTPQLYVQHLVGIFREIRRVLRKDGTVWLNLGDAYSGSNCGSNDYRPEGASLSKNDEKYQGQKVGIPEGYKPQDLLGIPW